MGLTDKFDFATYSVRLKLAGEYNRVLSDFRIAVKSTAYIRLAEIIYHKPF